jgi:hypothetical protein
VSGRIPRRVDSGDGPSKYWAQKKAMLLQEQELLSYADFSVRAAPGAVKRP